MQSTFGGLNTAVRGLMAQQTALDTVGHNVSNASTEGYSRQTVTLASTLPQTIYTTNGTMQQGTGVEATSIIRARDFLNDKQMWQETSTLNYATTRQNYLSKVETIFNEPTDSGVNSVMNDFYQSLQTLATNAADSGTRAAVRERGVELTTAAQHASSQLYDQAKDINASVASDVDNINEMTSEICSLNQQIAGEETTPSSHANDLRDKRDLLVDKLSKLVDVQVGVDTRGEYIITAGSNTLVAGGSFQKLATKDSTDPDYGYTATNVVVAATGTQMNFSNGEVKALIDSRDSVDTGTTSVKSYLNNLSDICKFYENDFNAVQRSGYGTDNSTNVNFFGNSVSADGQGVTLFQQSTQNVSNLAASWPVTDTTAGANTLSIADSAGNTMTLDLGALAGATPPVNTPAALAAYINTHASTASASGTAVNVRANYDSKTGIFSLYDTGSSTALTIAASGDQAKTLLSGLKLSDPPKSYWLDNMTVNQQLFDATKGLAEIAAKKAPNSGGIAVSNTTGTTGTGTAYATGSYTGAAPTTVQVKVVDSGGDIQYSTDGGTTWNGSNIAGNGSTLPQYSLTIDGANITLQLTGAANGDQYSFSLSADDTTSLNVTQSNSTGGIGTIASAAGIYTKGATATSAVVQIAGVDASGNVTGIKYSDDGGSTWTTLNAATGATYPNTYSFTVSGLAVKFSIAGNANNKVGDNYYFTLSEGNVASGDNAVALSSRVTTDVTTTLNNTSLNDYYASLISTLGVQSQNAQRLQDNQQLLVDQINTLRESVSGVNMDEEMTNMIKFQKGYNAAARILTTMDSMLDTLINNTGMVGR